MKNLFRICFLVVFILGLAVEVILYFHSVMPDLNHRLIAMIFYTIAAFDEFTEL